jgi:hypothetical protein
MTTPCTPAAMRQIADRLGRSASARHDAQQLLLAAAELIESLDARIQCCHEGHEYLAESHEYPCPSCAYVALEGIHTAWGVPSVVGTLADAADHFLRDHDCDCTGHEEIKAAAAAGRAWLASRHPPE